MDKLDSIEEIRKIDVQNVLGSIEALAKQCLHAWDEASAVRIPPAYSEIDNIVMTGMGGTGLGARVIQSVYGNEIRYPFTRINGYDIPAFVNEKSLVICASYSGTTEETLSNANQAIKARAKWIAIGTGGPLIDLAKRERVPYYQVLPTHNPSNQPRMAIGYNVVGVLALAAKIGVIQLSQAEIETAAKAMTEVWVKTNPTVAVPHNPAKKLAKQMLGRIIVYISAEHLVGSTHTINNQLNENAKAFSTDFQIPELNHHLLEGLKHPSTNPEHLFVIFAESSLYSEKIKLRFAITKEITMKNKIASIEISLHSETKLSQAFELIQFGAVTNLYLSILYDQNPAPIPWVDYFKEKLKN
ncbi:MAG: hypothetical protein A3F04_02040 [Candidatus Chisholmbacteria bacterium RIFCSPHIGHO2_12_FULL_49_9]|nr:MAG: hypothetical protein A3F04_02040 [Candidatus Chisholmbacteria bacterium RIFCSPHIGHO2_12_FULL_49_9]